jgi:hypothetical protein
LKEAVERNGFGYMQIAASDDRFYDIVGEAVPGARAFVEGACFSSRCAGQPGTMDAGLTRPQALKTPSVDVTAKSGCALVHCWAGINRSAAVAVALLMLLERCPLLSAIAAVVRVRGLVLQNKSFRLQLVRLAKSEGLLGPPLNEANDIGAGLLPEVAMCSWKTQDGTKLLTLVALAAKTGLGEELLDSWGYALRDWKERKAQDKVFKEFIDKRAQAVRSLLSHLAVAQGRAAEKEPHGS